MKKPIAAALLAVFVCIGAALPARAADLRLSAPSAVLLELSTGTVLYEANAHEPLPPASVTKVMTLLLIMEALDSGRIAWTDPVTASPAAAAKGGSQIYLKAGETMSVEDMVKSITVSSANDCACAMAEHLAGSEAGFVELMNRKAKELGMEDTNFVNCTGLDDGDNADQHRSSAYDIALMSRELLLHHPDIRRFTTIWTDTVRGGTFGLANTNKLIRFYPGATGLKTGYTSTAGHCLSASAEKDGMELVAVVLHCSSSSDRFQSARALLDYGFASFALVPVTEDPLPDVPVVLGTRDKVTPLLEHSDRILIEKNRQAGLTRQLTLEEQLTAPVEAGQPIGRLTLSSGDQVLAEIPLLADAPVEKLTFWEVYRILLGRVAMGA